MEKIQDILLKIEEISNRLDSLEKGLNRNTREIKILADAQNTTSQRLEALDLVDDKVQETNRLHGENLNKQKELHKDTKKSMQENQYALEDKVEEFKDEIKEEIKKLKDENTIIVKQSIWNRLKNSLKKGGKK